MFEEIGGSGIHEGAWNEDGCGHDIRPRQRGKAGQRGRDGRLAVLLFAEQPEKDQGRGSDQDCPLGKYHARRKGDPVEIARRCQESEQDLIDNYQPEPFWFV